MAALKNTLENKILRHLSLHHAMTENKLYELVNGSDSKEAANEFSVAVGRLYVKGLVDIIPDPTKTVKVVRLKQDVTYH